MPRAAAFGQEDAVATLGQAFGIEILTTGLQARIAPQVQTPTRPVQLADLPPSDTLAALRSLETGLLVYPPRFLQTLLHRIAMAGSITVFGQPAGGFFDEDMVAISYYNVQSPASAAFDTDTLHHELSSIVREHVTFNVSAWESANPAGFSYMDEAAYKRTLAQPGSVDGTDALHADGFVAEYGRTSLDNDWNTYAEKVFGHGEAFAREVARYPRMRQKTRQLLNVYERLEPAFALYFARTGLRQVAGE